MTPSSDDRPRCWCGAFADHTPAGIECGRCGEFAPTADADLRPSGYAYDEAAGRWIHTGEGDQ